MAGKNEKQATSRNQNPEGAPHVVATRAKIADKDIARAYAQKALTGIALSSQFPNSTDTIFNNAIKRAIKNGIIEHSGNVRNGWLTKKGIDFLDNEMRRKYLEAINRPSLRAG